MKKRKTYHHGALRQALLKSAETILRRDGLQALSLRAAAREAGVSHGSVAHHFHDLAGLLSELAAIGHQKLARKLREALGKPDTARADTARAYVTFALENPALFSLMFQEHRLDSSNPALADGRLQSMSVLEEVTAPKAGMQQPLMAHVGAMTSTWCVVHGFAVLAIDGRLIGLLRRAPDGTRLTDLLDAALADVALQSKEGSEAQPLSAAGRS